MNFEYLHYFLEVVQCGSISKAAQKLFLERSNLSTVISKLEKEFGAPLFIRSSKGVVLSPQGEKIYDWANRVLMEQAELKEIFSKEQEKTLSGKLSVYIPASISGTSYFQFFNDFISTHPLISTQIVEGNTEDCFNNVSNTPYSIGIIVTHAKNMTQLKKFPDLRYIFLKKVSLVAYVAKNSALAQMHRTISLKTLENLPCLIYTPQSVQTSPIADFLGSDYTFKRFSNITNLSLFQRILQTGKFFSIGTDISKFSPDMQNFTCIPIRDKIPLTHGLLVQKELLSDPLVSNFLQSFYKVCNLPFPKELL